MYRYSSSKRAFIFLSFYLASSSSRAQPPAVAAPATGTSTPALSPAEQRASELSSIQSALSAQGMSALDISDNELAKSHARYLVGGKSKVANERMFRFEFPERPGALRKFLETLGNGFNISLFHYRNHGGGASPFPLLFWAGSRASPCASSALGASMTPLTRVTPADVGKILCGIQVPPTEGDAFTQWLDSLEYPYVEETANPAYADFLGEDDDESDEEAPGR